MRASWASCATATALDESRAPDGGRQGAALAMVAAWSPGVPRQDIAVEGDAGYALLKMGV